MRLYGLLALGVLLTLGCDDADSHSAGRSSNSNCGDGVSAAGLPYAYETIDAEAIRDRATDYQGMIDGSRQNLAPLLEKSDQELRDMIAPAGTIRAMMVHRSGCPVHGGGTKVYEPFGRHPDLLRPQQVQCPIGEEWYPNEDFPDDGQGWLDDRSESPTVGERYYFVGWYQHWLLLRIGDHLQAMAQLWVLTDDDEVGHKAQVLLERFAETYADFDPEDLTYDGQSFGNYVKMTGTYWEGSVLIKVAKAVELLLPRLPPELVENVHERIYRAAYRAYRADPASGNAGNDWNPPLAKFASVLCDDEMMDFMWSEHPSAQGPVLDNQFFRDGFPFEASPDYSENYLSFGVEIAHALGESDDLVWDHPNFENSFHAYADLLALDEFTHYASDMGSPELEAWTLPFAPVRDAYLRYGSAELARYLLRTSEVRGGAGMSSIASFFAPEVAMDEVAALAATSEPLRSTIAPVRGYAMLRAGAGDDRMAVFFDHGFAHQAHHHADRLNFNIFAAGRDYLPEMGYPEYMDGQAPATGGWTTHTVSHITVEVDEKRQAPSVFGDLHAFVDLPGLKLADASCKDAYAHVGMEQYRRTLALVGTPGEDGAYVLDVFRVQGGLQHDYLLHGPAEPLSLEGVVLSAPQAGTLAGTDVAFGEKPGELAPYDVENSGYQYLFDVQQAAVTAPVTASWALEPSGQFKVRFLPMGDETFITAMGYPRPASQELPARPFLVRRKSHASTAGRSTFVSVLEVIRGSEVVTSADVVALSAESDETAVAVRVTRSDGEDVIIATGSIGGVATAQDGSFTMTGLFGLASWRSGQLTRLTLVGGSELSAGGQQLTLEQASWQSSIETASGQSLTLVDEPPAELAGRMLLVDRGSVRSAFRIQGVNGHSVELGSPVRIGRGRVGSVADGAIVDGREVFPLGRTVLGGQYPIRNYYEGAWITPEQGGGLYRLDRGGNDGFVLSQSQDLSALASDFAEQSSFIIHDVGPGDPVHVLESAQRNFP